MYKPIKQLEKLSYSQALVKLHLVSRRLNLSHIAPHLFCSGEYRAEVFPDLDGTFFFVFEKWYPVNVDKIQKMIDRLNTEQALKTFAERLDMIIEKRKV